MCTAKGAARCAMSVAFRATCRRPMTETAEHFAVGLGSHPMTCISLSNYETSSLEDAVGAPDAAMHCQVMSRPARVG